MFHWDFIHLSIYVDQIAVLPMTTLTYDKQGIRVDKLKVQFSNMTNVLMSKYVSLWQF